MKRLGLIILVAVQSALTQGAWAQSAPAPKAAAKRAEACAPIGRTEDGKLVYSMKCESIPKPVAPVSPPQAAAQPAPEPAAEPEPETQRSGVFGWSYDRRPKQ
ncbi:conserved protein of unknown function [Bradyrhizobium sp. ORS 285]|uniref:hypothetical protein n=1 Tax=Bradyrhizobium sp. ORS 285 TaxID=115808 RepID=UPI0002408F8E|nr:hypothetical protein [Bradyrhizobium sp. ORS 285]CCD87481.1 conserved hypothetical protein [Bradyrhizobium sp. ORS 285]SMX60366.1 conserved protein of unknown function [Bradyrhizobium sp. ORS 285]